MSHSRSGSPDATSPVPPSPSSQQEVAAAIGPDHEDHGESSRNPGAQRSPRQGTQQGPEQGVDQDEEDSATSVDWASVADSAIGVDPLSTMTAPDDVFSFVEENGRTYHSYNAPSK